MIGITIILGEYFSSLGVISINIVGTINSTSLTISWALAGGTTVTGYSISYSNTDTQCFTDSYTVSGIAAGETSHTLTDLEEGTEYTITVTALLAGGGTDEDSVTAITLAAGELFFFFSKHLFFLLFLLFPNIQLHLPLPLL